MLSVMLFMDMLSVIFVSVIMMMSLY